MFEEGRRGIMSVVEYVITRRDGGEGLLFQSHFAQPDDHTMGI